MHSQITHPLAGASLNSGFSKVPDQVQQVLIHHFPSCTATFSLLRHSDLGLRRSPSPGVRALKRGPLTVFMELCFVAGVVSGSSLRPSKELHRGAALQPQNQSSYICPAALACRSSRFMFSELRRDVRKTLDYSSAVQFIAG